MENLYWKVFSKEIPKIVEEGKTGVEFLLIPIMLGLYVAAGVFATRGWMRLRRVTQNLSLLFLGIIFLQCLCITKDLVLGVKGLMGGKMFLALAGLWYPLLAVLSAVIFGRRIYCHWICPLGFLQELTGARVKKRGLPILIALAVVIGLLILLFYPAKLIMGAGAWLGFLLIIASILSLKYPHRQFGFLKYIVLVGWAVLAIFVKMPGPWCVIGKANLVFSAIIPFFSVLLVSLVIPRAWCKFICPDGGLLQLLNRKKALTLILLISLLPTPLFACGGEEEGSASSFLCRCYKIWKIQGVEFRIETPNHSVVAGEPFPLTITALKDESVYNLSEEIMLTDSSQTIQPNKINLQDGIWRGEAIITKAQTTSIIASYYRIASESKDLFVKPSIPLRFIVQPDKDVFAPTKGTMTITARLIDEYGNPVLDVECRLSVISSGAKGRLSCYNAITDKEGIIKADYKLPSKPSTARIKIETKTSPAVSSLSGEIRVKR